MQEVRSYKLKQIPEQILALPKHTKMLSVQWFGEYPILYCLVDVDYEDELRNFQINTVLTGQEIPEFIGSFIDTYQTEGREYLKPHFDYCYAKFFHVFNRGVVS